MAEYMLQTKNLSKIYHQSDVVIKAVNDATVDIKKGEFVAIIGTSGSGKTTFLHICAGLDAATSGNVTIGGTDITKLNDEELGKFRGVNIGFVYQRHNLIPQFTALENILLPTMMCPKKLDYQKILDNLIDKLNLRDRLHHLPSEMSGGQQQRVSIARALINNPNILFTDEPTGNLDRKNADEVLELLLEIKKELNQTLVMVTHDLSIAERADRIIKMDNGIMQDQK